MKFETGHNAKKMIPWVTGLAGLLTLLIFLASALKWIYGRPMVKGMINSNSILLVGILLSSLATGLITWAVCNSIYKKARSKREMQRQSLNKPLSEKYNRFEDIYHKKVRYGYVPFYPTIKPSNNKAEPVGFGIELLKEIFPEGTLIPPRSKSSWKDMFDKLNKKKHDYDIIATPLYETTERMNEGLFCLPLFYSDIGAFISTSGTLKSLLERKNGFSELFEALNKIEKEITITVIEGEICEKIAKKHLPKAKLKYLNQGTYDIPDMLRNLMLPEDDPHHSDIFFCERWQAEEQDIYDLEIKNAMKHNELLFPVGFVVRKHEDTLRKFVNWRLMEINDRDDKTLLKMLGKSLDLSFDNEEHVQRLRSCFNRGKQGLVDLENSSTQLGKKVIDFKKR